MGRLLVVVVCCGFVTAPVSFPMEMLGSKLDYRRTPEMALAIFICATLVYLLGAGLASLASFLLRAARS
jgi:hypothetical protein